MAALSSSGSISKVSPPTCTARCSGGSASCKRIGIPLMPSEPISHASTIFPCPVGPDTEMRPFSMKYTRSMGVRLT